MTKTIDVHVTLEPHHLDAVIAGLELRARNHEASGPERLSADQALQKFRDVERKANA